MFPEFIVCSFSVVSNSGFFCYHFGIVANRTGIQAKAPLVKGIFSLCIEVRIICHHVLSRTWN